MPILAWNVPLIAPIFLKWSLVFPFYSFLLFLYIVHWRSPSYRSLLFSGTLHSVRYIFLFLTYLSLLFFPHLFVVLVPSCLSFSLGWFWLLPPVQQYKPPSIDFKACWLLDLIFWIYSSPPLNNHEIWFRSYMNGLVVSPTFLNLNLKFAIRSWWSKPLPIPGLVSADCIELFHLWLQRTWVSFQYWPSGDVHVSGCLLCYWIYLFLFYKIFVGIALYLADFQMPPRLMCEWVL